MKIGFIGKRSSGKTTLFESLSGLDIKEQMGSSLVHLSNVEVKDPRVDKLSDIYKAKKTTHAEFNIADYDRTHDTSNAMLGSASLISRYRELDAIVLVVGVSSDLNSIESELNDICVEFNLLDIMILEPKIQKMKKEQHTQHEIQLYESIIPRLEANELLSKDSFTKDDMRLLSSFQLFALKSLMLAVNVTEDILSTSHKLNLGRYSMPYMVTSAEIEKELTSLNNEERTAFLNELGISEAISERFIKMVYETMDLISFYTVNSNEARAWIIPRGCTALHAAGKIHSDMERGFIRASTIHYDNFIEIGDEAKAKAAGVIRDEGKDYIVQDGDIIHFKFNV